MFSNSDKVLTKVFNPLNITKSSIIEFEIGELKDTGMYRFNKIIEFSFGKKKYVRYLLYSKVENTEYVLEVFPLQNGDNECYYYKMVDTIPFTEEFLEIAGQLYFGTPQGDEYIRCTLPDKEDRIDGVTGTATVYDIASDQIEKQVSVALWDYQRDVDGITEYLNLEMWKETGIFRVFIGELVENIFYKFYQTSKLEE